MSSNAGALATYHKASHHLTVHSGHVTDSLTLLSPHGTHFTAVNDGHGGTEVTLDPPPVTATVGSCPPMIWTASLWLPMSEADSSQL
jgi:hypothetical protein